MRIPVSRSRPHQARMRSSCRGRPSRLPCFRPAAIDGLKLLRLAIALWRSGSEASVCMAVFPMPAGPDQNPSRRQFSPWRVPRQFLAEIKIAAARGPPLRFGLAPPAALRFDPCPIGGH